MDVSQVVGWYRARARSSARASARHFSRALGDDVASIRTGTRVQVAAPRRVALGDEKSEELYDRLMTIDPARSGYYRDVIARGVL